MENLHTSPWIVPDQQSLDVIHQIRPWAVERRFKVGATLFEQGEKVPGLYLVMEGTVKKVHINPEGTEELINVVSAGCPVGEVSVLDGLPSQVSAVAMTNVKALYLERHRLHELLQAEGELAVFLSLALTRQLRASVKHRTDAASRSVVDRLACLLHQLTRQQGPDQKGCRGVTLRWSHQQLAEILGVSRVTVSASLSELRKQGVIETGHRTLRILRPEALRNCGRSPYCITS